MSEIEQRASLSPLESEVMDFVWQHGRVTADDVHQTFAERMSNASVRTILRRIEAKGLLSHTQEGRAFIYSPRVEPGVVARGALKRVIDRFYQGSVEQLLVGLIDGRMTDHKALRALTERVARAAAAKKKKESLMTIVAGVRFALAMGVASVAASVVMGVGWLVSRRCCRNDASLWHTVWAAVAVASLVAPIGSLLPPVLRVAIPAALTREATMFSVAVTSPIDIVLKVVAGVYFVGAAALLVSFLVGFGASIRMRRTSRLVGAHDANRLQRVASDLAGIVRIQPRLRLPVTVGWRRAVILLPVSWTEWTDDRLAAVLRHEAAHIARRDFVWHAVAALQQAVFWINPAAWMLARQIRLTAELDADRRAAGAAREEYATELVAAAVEAQGLEIEHSVFAPGATHSLETRIDALLSSDRPATPSRPLARIVGAALFAALVVLPTLIQAIGVEHSSSESATHTAVHAMRHAQHPGGMR